MLWTALLLAACVGDRPCDDACRGERALALVASDPEAAFAEAGTITGVPTRDLVLLDLIGKTGWERCDTLADAALRDRCRTTLQRPHLLQGGHAAVSADCTTAAGAAADTCLLDRAEALLREDQLAPAADACARISDARWRDECTFRVSEHAPMPDKPGWCEKAGDFAEHCWTHLAVASGEAAAAAGFDALQAGAADAEARQRAPDGRWRADPALFWWSGLHVLAVNAALHGGLGAFRDTADAHARQRAALADRVAVQAHLQRSVAAREPAPDLATLRAWAAEEPWPGGAGRRATEAGAWGRAFTAADRGGGPVTSGFHLGRIPGAFAEGCALDADTARDVAIQWAIEPFDWPLVQPAVHDGLLHPNAQVRDASIDAAVERGLNRVRRGAPPGWLLADLDVLDTPLARAAATSLRNQRPGPLPDPAPCRPC
jgi:hypothetical protein